LKIKNIILITLFFLGLYIFPMITVFSYVSYGIYLLIKPNNNLKDLDKSWRLKLRVVSLLWKEMGKKWTELEKRVAEDKPLW